MATGLNFQTQTIINSNLDPDSGKTAVLFKSGKYTIDGVETDALRVKRDFVFAKDNVQTIRKRAGYEPALCKVTIDFSKLTDIVAPTEKKYCRLDIYLGVEGAEPFIYSTPWVQKGMPFWIEFTVKKGEAAADIVKDLVKIIKSDHNFQIDKDQIVAIADGTKLVLEGASEFLRFRNVQVRTFAETDEYSEKLEDIADENAITVDERGKNGFGTYSQIVKDLRLPTAANYQWSHIRQVETPIVGAVYNQYIIEYCAPATNDGMMFVGQRGMTYTSHVFWVKNDEALIKEWETALATVGTISDCDATSEDASTTSEDSQLTA